MAKYTTHEEGEYAYVEINDAPILLALMKSNNDLEREKKRIKEELGS
jgi:hypothetical protein